MVQYLIAVIYLLGFPTLLYAQSEDEIRAVARISIVITATDQVRRYGSGFAIGSDGYILTARHVVGDVDPARELIYVQFGSPNAPRYRAELSECPPGGSTDACLLQMSGSDLASAGVSTFSRLGCRALPVFERVTAAGWPGAEGNELDRVQGDITSILQNSLYPTTAYALPGMSGGPVYDRSGRIIGLIKGALNTNEPVTRLMITPLFRVQVLIRATPQTCETGYNPDTPAAVQPQAAPPPPAMTFVICEGQNEARCRPYQYDYYVSCYQVDNKIAELCQGRAAQRSSVRPSEGGNRCGYGWVRVSC
ncbi:hypothetical protein GOA61_18135 [Sinorhizobium meliloti]|nr:hypothetical protein [Sinorhizobium meliloti]MDW9877660.1 hypothetical protein [Sinorhizobium meliloti]